MQYCQVSALLELESLLSQQSLREAFSDAELSTAKQRHQQVQDYIQVRSAGAGCGVPTGRGWDRNAPAGLCERPQRGCPLGLPTVTPQCQGFVWQHLAAITVKSL